MKKTVVIGLDGATWELLDQLKKTGFMQNFEKIDECAVSGILESTIPPVTGPAWVSFATGTNPGKHGCFDFILPVGSLNNTRTITTNDIHGTTFYEILHTNKKKCMMVNLPCSYPPKINTPTITSLMTKGNNCVFPKNLVEEIPILNDYRIIPNMKLLVDGDIKRYIEDIRNVEKTRFECSKHLFKQDWDFFFILFSGTDWLQHVAYNKLNKDKKLLKLYSDIDQYINWFIINAPKDTNFLFISDHGFKTFQGTFFINEWLKREGYLKTEKGEKNSVKSHLMEEAFSEGRKSKICVRLPKKILNGLVIVDNILPLHSLYTIITKYLPIDISKSFRTEMPKISESHACCIANQSRAIHLNINNKFNDGIIKGDEDYNTTLNGIISKLNQLKNPMNGKCLLTALKKEDVYFGQCFIDAPDIILLLDDYVISTDFFPSVFQNNFSGLVNNHDPNGIFLAHGPDIKQGATIEGARIIDLAPTILHMFGVPIPQDMDGHVLTEIFRKDSEMAKREIVYEEEKTKTEKDRDALKNRIGKLKQKRNI